ncbi:MAG: DUF418 domain-containing protein, partial [Polyangiaceae bacterium]
DGGFFDVLRFRVDEVRPIAALLASIVPRTLGLFLLGTCAWRLRLFTRDLRGPFPILLTVVTLVIGGLFRDVASNVSAILLALGYGGAVVIAHSRPLGARVLDCVAPLGRMALTNYLSQSVIMGFIFYGYGLGLFGKLDLVPAAVLCVVVYVAQAIVSAIWLRHFELGPAEWAWRSITYGAPQRMRADTTDR